MFSNYDENAVNYFVRNPFQSGGPSLDNANTSSAQGAVESRVAGLEEWAIDTQKRLIRIETRLEQTVTSAEFHRVLGALHKDIGLLHKDMNMQTWRLVTFVCGFGSVLVAATHFIATHMK